MIFCKYKTALNEVKIEEFENESEFMFFIESESERLGDYFDIRKYTVMYGEIKQLKVKSYAEKFILE